MSDQRDLALLLKSHIHLRAEFARTRPLSVVMAEQAQALRDRAGSRTVPAA